MDIFEENEKHEMKISQTDVKFSDSAIDDSLVDFSSKEVLDFAVKSFKDMQNAVLPCPACNKPMLRSNDSYVHSRFTNDPKQYCILESIVLQTKEDILKWNCIPRNPSAGIQELKRIYDEYQEEMLANITGDDEPYNRRQHKELIIHAFLDKLKKFIAEH